MLPISASFVASAGRCAAGRRTQRARAPALPNPRLLAMGGFFDRSAGHLAEVFPGWASLTLITAAALGGGIFILAYGLGGLTVRTPFPCHRPARSVLARGGGKSANVV